MNGDAISPASELAVAMVALGPLGRRLQRGWIKESLGLRLAAVSARDQAKAEANMAAFSGKVPVLPLGELADCADIVVECTPAAVFREAAEPALAKGRIFMPLSVGALLSHDDLIDLAKSSGGRIVVPTGALLGLDAVRAAAEGEIESVTMVTRKPPDGLAGAPYLEEHGIDVFFAVSTAQDL